VTARIHGHEALGFDTDPLALLIAKTWSSDVDGEKLSVLAAKTLNDARQCYRSLNVGRAYPASANKETRAFVRFWFDSTNRRQLTALSLSISKVKDKTAQAVLWCAFSRMIITKGAGVSLAIDVSHSRPHRAYGVALIKPFAKFLHAVEQVLRASRFSPVQKLPKANVRRGDARCIPLDDHSVDLVITSPPYVNAIDYLRGHKLSLVWMGHQIAELRNLRSTNIGSEKSRQPRGIDHYRNTAERVVQKYSELPKRSQAMLSQYFQDMDCVLAEISRILKRRGKAVIVVGNSTIRGVFVSTSRVLTHLARANGMQLLSARKRDLKESKRYLPPPGNATSGVTLRSRMNEEVILTFQKTPAGAKGRNP